MHYVGRVDWAFADVPGPDGATSSGLSRQVIVGPGQGATHTELAVGAFASGGWLGRHVHSFEEALYVLEGELVLELDGRVHRLGGGHYAVITIGTAHTLVAGSARVRWLSVNTPPRRVPGSGAPDTVFAPTRPDVGSLLALASTPDPGDPTTRFG